MERVAQVWINIPTSSINKFFSYRIPPYFDYVDAGWRVLVPFGNQKLEGFVVAVTADTTEEYELKPILDVLDSEAWFDEPMLRTARWISQYYLCTLAEAMRLFIPGKSGIKTIVEYSVADTINIGQTAHALLAKSEEYQRLFMYVANQGNCRLSQLETQFGLTTAKILRYLMLHDILHKEVITKKSFRRKYQTIVQLGIDRQMAVKVLDTLSGKPAQRRLLTELLSKDKLSTLELQKAQITKDTVKRLVEAGIVVTLQQQVLRDSYAQIADKITAKVKLTIEQEQVLRDILPAIQKKSFQSFLLHGITGSGKTQVYIEAVIVARQHGQQAIVLVPEIALTGQIVARFRAQFGDDVVVMHSKLSVGERHDAWQRLRDGQAGIVIGARSAIFAPTKDLGIIVIDEEHEFTYKQEEAPRYHTKQVALVRAKLAKAVLVLGSATPSVESYYEALQGQHSLLTLFERVDNSFLPEVAVVDMREELKKGRRSVISLPLQQLLSDAILRGEQAIILLNRRGYATFVLCRECGHIIKCSHCAVSMVYHTSGATLRCHYCQTREVVPTICPVCKSRYIRFFGTGTQKLEEELVKILPNVRIVRMDQDTTSGKMGHDHILTAFAKGDYDILLGTQMVAKGHDIKNVTAVGIIAADSALNLPDFRAAERTFALLTQAAGRAGRGDKPGRVVVQTYNAEHYSIQAGAAHDYVAFYNTEIEHRQELGYPPLGQILKLTIQANDDAKARRLAEEIASSLRLLLEKSVKTEIIGPFPAAIAKVKDVFRMNILVKAMDLREIKAQVLTMGLPMRPDVIVDVDPINIM